MNIRLVAETVIMVKQLRVEAACPIDSKCGVDQLTGVTTAEEVAQTRIDLQIESGFGIRFSRPIAAAATDRGGIKQ